MEKFERLLAGGDLRSIGKSNAVVLKIRHQEDFDNLIRSLFNDNRLIVMRAADAVEKITISNPQYLNKHKKKIIELCTDVKDKELKWHLALLIPRLVLSSNEIGDVREMLTDWALDKTNSRIVRVNSIQGLFEMTKYNINFKKELDLIFLKIEKENIPSINARIKKIRKQIGRPTKDLPEMTKIFQRR